MTVSARAWAWQQIRRRQPDGTIVSLTGPQKAVLVCLAEHENYEWGVSFPGIPRIAIWCCIGERTVKDALRRLEESHLIETTRERGTDGKFPRNIYDLAVTAEYREKDAKWQEIHGDEF